MEFRSRATRVLVVAAMLAIYVAGVWIGLTEEGRRSLGMMGAAPTGEDYVIINVRVASIDTAQGLLHGRLRVIPMGRFAKDKATPAVDLKLLINSVSGKQTVVFPAGERIFPMDFTSLLSGNQNRYPFDSYLSDIEFLVTAPAKKPTQVLEGPLSEESLQGFDSPLIVGSSDLDKSEAVAIKETLDASIPALKFTGTMSPVGDYKLMQNLVTVRRANSVILVSIVVMAVMFVLAVSIMLVVLRTMAAPGVVSLVPMTFCTALIFGLPALRNTQPGVGVVGDYMSFIWAEFIVSSSAIALAWTYITRSLQARKSLTPL